MCIHVDSLHVSVYLSTYLSIYLSIYLSVYLYISIKQNHSWERNRQPRNFLPCMEHKFHYYVHKTLLLIPVLC